MLSRHWVCRIVRVITGSCLILALCPAAAEEKPKEKKQRDVEITAPEEGQKVAQIEDVEGRMKVKTGWPVLLVKPLIAGERWYVQHPVEKIDEGGAFSTQAHFGNEDTKEGTEFRIAAVIAKNEAEAKEKYKLGMTFRSLPADLPRSEYVNVVRK